MKCGAVLFNVSTALLYLTAAGINSKGAKIKQEWLALGFPSLTKKIRKQKGLLLVGVFSYLMV